MTSYSRETTGVCECNRYTYKHIPRSFIRSPAIMAFIYLCLFVFSENRFNTEWSKRFRNGTTDRVTSWKNSMLSFIRLPIHSFAKKCLQIDRRSENHLPPPLPLDYRSLHFVSSNIFHFTAILRPSSYDSIKFIIRQQNPEWLAPISFRFSFLAPVFAGNIYFRWNADHVGYIKSTFTNSFGLLASISSHFVYLL